MKTERNILVAFVLNLAFSIFECIGGLITGSVAILSDAMHDVGDAVSIGVSYFLEKKSKGKPNEEFTYGYGRYSVSGGLITTTILLAGSVIMICNAVHRIFVPTRIHYNGMIVFALVGVAVNFVAALFTRGEGSLNQKAVNLHMLEDVLGWMLVLVGAIVMRFTDFSMLDPIMSIGVSLFILINAVKNLKAVFDLFLEKVPQDVNASEIREHIRRLDGVLDVHHIHIWSMDGQNHFATMHIVTDCDPHMIKDSVRRELRDHGIGHVTLELELKDEHCHERHCASSTQCGCNHVHHHHHH